MNAERNTSEKVLRVAWWVVFAAVLAVVTGVRIRLLGIPLERDEGEYAYAGQLMLQGIPPYKLAYNMKFPGTYAAYALIMSIFGQTSTGIHLGLLIVNAATVALVFLLGRRLFDTAAGLAAAAAYAILSVSPTVLGFAGHATHFVVFPVLAGVWLLLDSSDRQSTIKIFLSGLFFGLGLLMKQPGAVFILFGAISLLVFDWRAKLGFTKMAVRTASLIGGAVVPLAITCLLLWRAGVFEKFWFWAIQYAREYGSRVSLSLGAQVFGYAIGDVIGSNWAIWLIAALGLIACVWNARSRSNERWLLGFLFFSALAVCPGFYFRPHYFILALPAIALLVGIAASQAGGFISFNSPRLRFVFLLVFTAAITWPLIAERDFFFTLPPDAASRLANGPNPFPESVRIGNYLKERTGPNDTIAVLGSEPQIYFYAQRHSATGYIYTYSLMEPHRYAARMQKEMVDEIEAAQPTYVVFVSIDTSWLARPESERLLFDWFDRYSTQYLKAVGFVNIISNDRTDYYLPYASESLTRSRYYLEIYERKS